MKAMAIRIGDAYEFDTPCGLAYFQVAVVHPRYKTLIRVLTGLYETRPDLESLVRKSDRFKVLYPVSSAARQGLIRLVGAFPLPVEGARFPLMKWPLGGDGHRYGWSIWDGRNELERRRDLTDEQKGFPEPGIWNHALLLDNVASDWSWRDTAEAPPWRRPKRPAGCVEPFSYDLEEDPGDRLTKDFLYFDRLGAAERAKREVRETMRIARTEVSDAGSGRTPLLVLHAPSVAAESLRDDFENIARTYGGRYDGWEASVD